MNVLPRALLLLVVVSAHFLVAVSETGSNSEELEDEVDTTSWMSARQPGRFLQQRRQNPRGQNQCGGGRAPNFACRLILPRPEFTKPRCCRTRNRIRQCFDVGADDENRCGSCTRSCRNSGRKCCAGQCVNLRSSRRNCGRCGNRCPRYEYCLNGMCGYNGRDD